MKAFLSLGLAFILRVLIPGAVGASILIPLIFYVGTKFGIELKISPTSGLFFTALLLSMGFLVTFLDYFIYRIFEGYLCWPKWFREYFTNKLNNKIKKKMKFLNSTNDQIKKKVLQEWLMFFPLKKNRKNVETEAVFPTKLGNILFSYENYPNSRYGMSSVFFWHRLWLFLDKDRRKEINNIWAEADCLTYISFIFLATAILYIFTFLVDWMNIPTFIFGSIGNPLDTLTSGSINLSLFFLLGASITSLILFYLFYLLSLPLHVKNGNYFQSVFDLYRNDIKESLQLKRNEVDFWYKTWAYLKYGLKKCNKCKKYYPSEMKNCPNCSK